VLKGDVDSYALIVERYETKLLRYAGYLLKDPDQAADAVQEAFIKAYINLRSFNLNKQFSSWIYRITHNEAMNLVKKHKKTFSFSDLDINNDTLAVNYAYGANLDKMFLKKEVQGCLQKLHVKYQEVVVLYYFQNQSYEEISDILHIPKSTVGVRINRAKKLLKTACEAKGVNI
jgi:RNA polymerase sigma-70 factor, ECF subfamily